MGKKERNIEFVLNPDLKVQAPVSKLGCIDIAKHIIDIIGIEKQFRYHQ